MSGKKRLVLSTVIIVVTTVVVCLCILTARNDEPMAEIVAQVPSSWDSKYTESAKDYTDYNSSVSWSTVTPKDAQGITISNADTSASYTISADVPINKYMTSTDRSIALLQENDAWSYITGGIYTTYPTGSFNDNKSKLVQLRNDAITTITIKVWYWKNPSDQNDLDKVTAYKELAINKNIATTVTHIFEDIYDNPSKPVINIGDLGMGTWVLRGKNHNDNASLSAHALGVAVDINPSTGSFCINNIWYGNGYGQKMMPEQVWVQLPETHQKYQVLYDNSPIVIVFKSYGFYWGGDFSTSDAMHLSYIGDGSNSRQHGIDNYNKYR